MSDIPSRIADAVIEGYVEDMVDLTEEALDEAHLIRLVKDYVSYYHGDCTHDGLNKDTPATRAVAPKPTESARLIAHPRVGGLHHRYDWQQAA